MSTDKSKLSTPFKLGDYVHVCKSYHRGNQNKTLVVGKITTLLNKHCGVTPSGGNKELFFFYDELKRQEESENQRNVLSVENK